MARKRKKAGKKTTRGAARTRAKKTAKTGAARGRRLAKKTSAARSGASKRMARKRPAKKPASPRKAVAARPSTLAPASAGEMYGEADWRADDEHGAGLAPLSQERDLTRRVAEDKRAEGAKPKREEESEW